MIALPQTVLMPVAVAPAALTKELGASAKIVMVSNDTMRAKVSKHGYDGRGGGGAAG